MDRLRACERLHEREIKIEKEMQMCRQTERVKSESEIVWSEMERQRRNWEWWRDSNGERGEGWRKAAIHTETVTEIDVGEDGDGEWDREMAREMERRRKMERCAEKHIEIGRQIKYEEINEDIGRDNQRWREWDRERERERERERGWGGVGVMWRALVPVFAKGKPYFRNYMYVPTRG